MRKLYRVAREDDGLQVDFMATVHGIRSYEGVRDRATMVHIDGTTLAGAAAVETNEFSA